MSSGSPRYLTAFNNLIKNRTASCLSRALREAQDHDLYGALDKVNFPDKKIITVEDPWSISSKGKPDQVKTQIGLDFSTPYDTS